MQRNATSSATTGNSYFGILTSLFSKTDAPQVVTAAQPPAKKQRERTEFEDNITASLALPDKFKIKAAPGNDENGYLSAMYQAAFKIWSRAPEHARAAAPVDDRNVYKWIKELEQQLQGLDEKDPRYDELMLKQIEAMRYEIEEHAARRIDLFFYLLVAVYGTGYTVSKDTTKKQHGRGHKELNTHGCHSSLFPAVKLTPPPSGWLSFMSSSTPLTLEDTHFKEVLNMVVESKSVVNDFDGHIEGRYEPTRYVEACLEILNSASRKEIDPIQGMNRLFRTMNSFFERFDKNHLKRGKIHLPKTTQKIWEYEKNGTFQAANPDMTVSYDYVYMMLRMTRAEIHAANYLPLVSGKILERNFSLIQAEIFSKKPAAR